MLCSLGLHRKTGPGFKRAEGHQRGAPLSYPRPGVTLGDLEEKRMWAGGTIVRMAAVQGGTKWNRPFLVFWDSKGYHQGSLAPFRVKIWRDLFALAIPCMLPSTTTALSTCQVTGEHLPAHAFPRRV